MQPILLLLCAAFACSVSGIKHRYRKLQVNAPLGPGCSFLEHQGHRIELPNQRTWYKECGPNDVYIAKRCPRGTIFDPANMNCLQKKPKANANSYQPHRSNWDYRRDRINVRNFANQPVQPFRTSLSLPQPPPAPAPKESSPYQTRVLRTWTGKSGNTPIVFRQVALVPGQKNEEEQKPSGPQSQPMPPYFQTLLKEQSQKTEQQVIHQQLIDNKPASAPVPQPIQNFFPGNSDNSKQGNGNSFNGFSGNNANANKPQAPPQKPLFPSIRQSANSQPVRRPAARLPEPGPSPSATVIATHQPGETNPPQAPIAPTPPSAPSPSRSPVIVRVVNPAPDNTKSSSPYKKNKSIFGSAPAPSVYQPQPFPQPTQQLPPSISPVGLAAPSSFERTSFGSSSRSGFGDRPRKVSFSNNYKSGGGFTRGLQVGLAAPSSFERTSFGSSSRSGFGDRPRKVSFSNNYKSGGGFTRGLQGKGNVKVSDLFEEPLPPATPGFHLFLTEAGDIVEVSRQSCTAHAECPHAPDRLQFCAYNNQPFSYLQCTAQGWLLMECPVGTQYAEDRGSCIVGHSGNRPPPPPEMEEYDYEELEGPRGFPDLSMSGERQPWYVNTGKSSQQQQSS